MLALHPLPLGCNESHRLLACRERAAACAAAGAGFCDLHGRRVRCAVRACAVRALCPQPADCWPFLATSVRHCVATWCTVLQRGVLCCNVVHCAATWCTAMRLRKASVSNAVRPPRSFVGELQLGGFDPASTATGSVSYTPIRKTSATLSSHVPSIPTLLAVYDPHSRYPYPYSRYRYPFSRYLYAYTRHPYPFPRPSSRTCW